MTDQLFRLISTLDNHFAAPDISPADVARWRDLKRHLEPMKDALDLVHPTLREKRERGIPLTREEARKLEEYVRLGLAEPVGWGGVKDR